MTYKLLLADDSVTIQRVIELTFAEEDVTVSTVGDGQAAIDRLETDPPDIVLADVDMPKRDGYEVASYVRARPKLAHIPVVLLTGAFEPIDHARAAAAGSSDVLAKPFEPQMVINRVKQLLGRKRVDVVEAPVQSLAPEAPPPVQPSPQSLNAPAAPRPPARSSMAMNDEHASLQNQPARQAPGQAVAQEPVSLDDYFDQLDAAFSSLQQPAAPAAQHDTKPADEAWLDSQVLNQEPVSLAPLMTPPAEPEMTVPDWPADPPVAVAPPPPPVPPPPAPKPPPVPPVEMARPAPEPIRLAPPAPAPVPVPPAPVPPAQPAGNPRAEVPAAAAEVAAPPAVPLITEEVIEELVARVLKRLSDRVVRETVTDIVSQTAERLVQEEIDRIKAEGQ